MSQSLATGRWNDAEVASLMSIMEPLLKSGVRLWEAAQRASAILYRSAVSCYLKYQWENGGKEKASEKYKKQREILSKVDARNLLEQVQQAAPVVEETIPDVKISGKVITITIKVD